MTVASLHAIPSALPHNIEAEKSIIGAIFLAPQRLLDAVDQVDASCFYHPSHAAIYQAMCDLDARRQPIDPITVAEQMRADDSYQRIQAQGGEAYFSELMSAVVTVENIAFHARLVAEAARRRRVMHATDVARRVALEGEEGWSDEAGKAVFEALEERRDDSMRTMREIARSFDESFQAKIAAGAAGQLAGISTGIGDLDRMLGGLQPKRQYILAARPKAGKTTFVAGLCLRAALDHAIPSLIFSLEMDSESLFGRMLCAEGGIETTKVNNPPTMLPSDHAHFARAAGRIADAPITVEDRRGLTLSKIRAKTRRWRASQTAERQARPAIVVVDYVQIVDSEKAKNETLAEAIGRVSKGLRDLSAEVNCVSIVLSQLSRGVARDDRRPQMHDLRDSGSLESDADAIVFLHPTKNSQTVEIIVDGNRHGPTGTARSRFERWCGRFVEADSRDEEVLVSPRPPTAPTRAARRAYQTTSAPWTRGEEDE